MSLDNTLRYNQWYSMLHLIKFSYRSDLAIEEKYKVSFLNGPKVDRNGLIFV